MIPHINRLVRFAAGAAIVLALMTTFVHPAYATVTSMTITLTSGGSSADCSAGGMGFNINFTFTTTPSSVTFNVLVFDGSGNPVGSGGGGGISATSPASGGGGFSWSGATKRPFTIKFYDATSPSIVVGSLTFDPATVLGLTKCANMPFATAPTLFTDGRVNNMDAGQTGAVYCIDGGVQVLHPNGRLGLTITKEKLDAFISSHKLTGSQNALIKSQDGFKLYLLSDGRLELVGPSLDGPRGNNYVFIWGGC